MGGVEDFLIIGKPEGMLHTLFALLLFFLSICESIALFVVSIISYFYAPSWSEFYIDFIVQRLFTMQFYFPDNLE